MAPHIGKRHDGTTRVRSGNVGTEARSGDGSKKLPAGLGFMPQVRLNRLIKMAVRGKEGVEKSRLLAARMRKEGKSIRQIVGTLCKPYSTVRDWLVRMHRRGSRGRFDKKRRGGKRLLSNGDLKRLRRLLYEDPKEHGFGSNPWQADMILELIERKFGTVCSLRTLRRILHKTHFSYRKSRPVPHNSASKEEQEKFKTDTDVLLEGLRKEEFAILAEDEGKMQTLPENGYGWRPTNGNDTVPTDFSKESVRMFCAVGDGRLHVWPADATNSETFVDVLKDLHRTYPRFALVLDNASYHKSRKVTEYVKSIGKDPKRGIRLIFLPPYTPQLNPTEIQLRGFKKRLAGRHFGSADELKGAIMAIVDSGEMKPVRLMSYLLPWNADRVHIAWNAFISGHAACCA